MDVSYIKYIITVCMHIYIYYVNNIYMSTLCWLIEVIFLLGFYYYIYLLFIFIIVSYLGSMVPPCRYTQSSIKGINIEGCKIRIGSEPINNMNTRL